MSSSPPKFYKELTDITVPEGECTVLECRLKATPHAKVTWYREGYPIEDSPDFRILHNDFLDMYKARNSFHAEFDSEAGDEARVPTTPNSIQLMVHQVARAIKAWQPLTIYELGWLLATHVELPINNGYEAVADQRLMGDVATLVVGTAYSEDSGMFECVATNSEGSARSSCNLLVTGGGYYSVSTKEPSASRSVVTTKSANQPRLPTDDPSSTCNETYLNAPCIDHDKQIAQESAGISSATDTQHLNSATVSTHSSTSMIHSPLSMQDALTDANHNFQKEKNVLVEELSRKLTTDEVPVGRPGEEYKVSSFEQRLINEIEYRLERTPPVNEDPNDVIFENVPPQDQKPPFFKNVIGSYKVIIGSPMKFMCRIGGSPTPKIYWFKDGKQISIRSQHFLRSKQDDGIYCLSIPRTCVEDDGNYTVLALNPKGRVSCTGKLSVVATLNTGRTQPIPQRSDARMPEKGTLAEDEESPLEKYFKPVFVKKSGNIEVEAGKLARLDVKVTGLPAPELEWLVNGNPVHQDQHHRIIVRENNVHSLLIQPVDGMDEGQYSVVASNRAGKATVHMELRVIAKEETSVPIFVQRLTPQVAVEGGSVKLEACVIGKPQPKICWKKGSDEIINTPRTQLIQDESGNVCLLITEATRFDSDWYTCSATNKAGIASCNCKLDVYAPHMDAPHQRRRIRTPHRYANLAKTAGIDMRESISPDASATLSPTLLPESEDL